MQATQILMVDHEEAKTMLDTLASGELTHNDPALFGRLKESLDLHAEVEEQIFYPALESFDETKQLIQESYEDHDEIKDLLDSMGPGNADWEDQIVDLRKKVLRHAEEEERELFPKAESLLGAEGLVRLGDQIQALKAGRQPVAASAAMEK
jgi:hemerythrin superfamily protein